MKFWKFIKNQKSCVENIFFGKISDFQNWKISIENRIENRKFRNFEIFNFSIFNTIFNGNFQFWKSENFPKKIFFHTTFLIFYEFSKFQILIFSKCFVWSHRILKILLEIAREKLLSGICVSVISIHTSTNPPKSTFQIRKLPHVHGYATAVPKIGQRHTDRRF